jgi:uncharacterized membrane protein YidH (DUF202 family)
MTSRTVLALVLIVFGVFALAYGRISFTREETVVDAGPFELKQEKRETIPLSPVLGGVALASGLVIGLWPRKA